MRYARFVIKKFKGIQELELDLKRLSKGKVFPLVGLNESGKTTILEAINFFKEDLEDDKKHTILHKKDSGSFTGSVEIEAELLLDQSDIDHIKKTLEKKGLRPDGDVKSIVITKKQNYENASFKNGQTTLKLKPELKVQQIVQQLGQTTLKFKPELKEADVLFKLRQLKKTPPILYFPDFLFDFPDKIYLDNESIEKLNGKKEKEIQKRHIQAIEDILHTISENYSLKDFLEKLKSKDPDKESAANQIKNQISSTLNQKITKPWQEIFGELKKTEKKNNS